MSDVWWTGAGRFDSGQCTIIHPGDDRYEKVGIICDEEVAKTIGGLWNTSNRLLLDL